MLKLLYNKSTTTKLLFQFNKLKSTININKSNIHIKLWNDSRQFSKFNRKETIYTLNLLTKLGLSLGGCILAKVIHNSYVLCKHAQNSRIIGYKRVKDDHIPFDWKMFYGYLLPHIFYLLAAIIGAFVVALLNIQIPQLMGSAINVIAKFTEMKDSQIFFNEMRMPAIKLISMYLVQSAFTFFYITMLSNVGEKLAYNIRKDLYSSIVKQDIEFFDRHRSGEIIHRLTSDVQDFKSSFKQTVSGGLRAATQIIGCSISLVLISPQMTFVTLLCIPTIIGVGTALGDILRITSRNAQEQTERTTAVADEAIGNIRTVRSFANENLEIDLYTQESEKAMILNQKLGLGIGFFQAGTNMFLNSMVLGTLYMGGYLLSTNQLSSGELMAYLMATQTIQRSLAQISLLFGSVMQGISAGSRVFEFIRKTPNMHLTGGIVIQPAQLRGDIEFKDVGFSYPIRPEQRILDKFSLKIPAGKTVAIVGASGNGKSTIVALLERFYDVHEGTITIDGFNVTTLDPSWMRRSVMALISQEPVLFGTSVMENIRYGKPDATNAEVREAAIMANADSFIMSFPLGYNTLVGERGAALSGGQKQRIAIARALLKKPTILLLDEATSALDAESEKNVQAALDEARHGRTVIIIAHRLSTVKNADVIVVLNRGRIVEIGTHQQLLDLKGHYWSLTYQQQQIPGG